MTNFVIANASTNSVDQTILERAYEAACDELQKKHNINHAALAELIDPITGALLDLYGVGQRDEKQLSCYAVSRALARLRGTSYKTPRDPPPIIDTLAAVSSVKAASRSRENFP